MTSCAECAQEITDSDSPATIGRNKWHADCFKCAVCGIKILKNRALPRHADSMPLCMTCYQKEPKSSPLERSRSAEPSSPVSPTMGRQKVCPVCGETYSAGTDPAKYGCKCMRADEAMREGSPEARAPTALGGSKTCPVCGETYTAGADPTKFGCKCMRERLTPATAARPAAKPKSALKPLKFNLEGQNANGGPPTTPGQRRQEMQRRKEFEIERLFIRADLDQDGSLSLEELQLCMDRTFGIDCLDGTQLTYEDVMKMMDIDHNGVISYNEFKSLYNALERKLDEERHIDPSQGVAASMWINLHDPHGHLLPEEVEQMRYEEDVNRKRLAMRSMFEHYDVDGNGGIDLPELQKLLFQMFGQHVIEKKSEHTLEVVMQKLDIDHNGLITFDEFQRLYDVVDQFRKSSEEDQSSAVANLWLGISEQKRLESDVVAEDIALDKEERRALAMFRDADTDHSGGIDLEELKALFVKLYGEAVLDKAHNAGKTVLDVMHELDRNCDGVISYSEFEALRQAVASVEQKTPDGTPSIQPVQDIWLTLHKKGGYTEIRRAKHEVGDPCQCVLL